MRLSRKKNLTLHHLTNFDTHIIIAITNMVVFFKKGVDTFYAIETDHKFSENEIERLAWLLDGAKPLAATSVKGRFVGPRKEMITPWSTNAVEITQNTGLTGIFRIEEFTRVADPNPTFDPMLQRCYDGLNSKLFSIDRTPEPVHNIENIS